MAVVKINAIEVPEGAGPGAGEAVRQPAARRGRAAGVPLLRAAAPGQGRDRYFVVTHWDTEESFQAWLQGPAMTAHSGERARPVASGSSLLEFEVVQHSYGLLTAADSTESSVGDLARLRHHHPEQVGDRGQAGRLQRGRA